ncbi:hypothetical protein BS78_02G139000, partial [Paspalum vaginatum]
CVPITSIRTRTRTRTRLPHRARPALHLPARESATPFPFFLLASSFPRFHFHSNPRARFPAQNPNPSSPASVLPTAPLSPPRLQRPCARPALPLCPHRPRVSRGLELLVRSLPWAGGCGRAGGWARRW